MYARILEREIPLPSGGAGGDSQGGVAARKKGIQASRLAAALGLSHMFRLQTPLWFSPLPLRHHPISPAALGLSHMFRLQTLLCFPPLPLRHHRIPPAALGLSHMFRSQTRLCFPPLPLRHRPVSPCVRNRDARQHHSALQGNSKFVGARSWWEIRSWWHQVLIMAFRY